MTLACNNHTELCLSSFFFDESERNGNKICVNLMTFSFCVGRCCRWCSRSVDIILINGKIMKKKKLLRNGQRKSDTKNGEMIRSVKLSVGRFCCCRSFWHRHRSNIADNVNRIDAPIENRFFHFQEIQETHRERKRKSVSVESTENIVHLSIGTYLVLFWYRHFSV